jgi:hypothetical protein
MFKTSIEDKLSKGQVLPLIVLMMFVIIGMIALILDGGAILSFRRSAQAAADAGALAGAQRVCRGYSDWKSVAESYAINNGASSAVATLNGKEVTVVAEESNPSFFARIFGQDTLQASASATAGCFYPDAAKRVLPISFYYKSPPVNAKDAVCDTDGSCTLVAWDFDELMTALSTTSMIDTTTDPGTVNLPLDDIYIISDKTKVCEKNVTGDIICSEMEGLTSGGNRSFLDLNDVPQKIIADGLTEDLHLPVWVNGEPGAVTSVYKPSNFITDYPPIVGYESLSARLYFLPVYDKYCMNCGCEPTEDYDPIYCDQYNSPAYHLVGFGSFVVTCVQMNSKCEYGDCVLAGGPYNVGGVEVADVKKDICPGLLASDPQQENVTSAIEGYFVEEFPADQYLWGTEGVDVGVYLIDLSD